MSGEAWLIVRHKALPERTVPLTGDLTIGRVTGNDLVLPSGNIGKRHARVVTRDGKWIIVDLKADNGSYVNGQRLHSPRVLKDGDKIYIGDYTLHFRQPRALIHDVRRRGRWITVNEPDGLAFPAVDATSTQLRLLTAVQGVVPLGVELVDQIDPAEDLQVVEDIAGVWFTELQAATPAGVHIDPSIVAQVARAAVASASPTTLAQNVVSPWLTFDGRVLPMTATGPVGSHQLRLRSIADALQPGLTTVAELMRCCEAEPAPSPAYVAGVVANVLPERRATHERLVEELGVLGVEGLLALVR